MRASFLITATSSSEISLPSIHLVSIIARSVLASISVKTFFCGVYFNNLKFEKKAMQLRYLSADSLMRFLILEVSGGVELAWKFAILD